MWCIHLVLNCCSIATANVEHDAEGWGLQASELLKRAASKLNLIVAHLGAGASVTAVKEGKSFDTSMGLTPLEGSVT